MIILEEGGSMKKELLLKPLALGIVVLFIGGVNAPGTSAVDKETDYYDELKSRNENGVIVEYEEIITFIIGFAKINWIERRGLFRGEVNLTSNGYSRGYTNLSGFRRSESGIEYYNELVVLNETDFVYAYHFIGLNTPNIFLEPPPVVKGIAFGNIEWGEMI
jgi:hypothetical protein